MGPSGSLWHLDGWPSFLSISRANTCDADKIALIMKELDECTWLRPIKKLSDIPWLFRAIRYTSTLYMLKVQPNSAVERILAVKIYNDVVGPFKWMSTKKQIRDQCKTDYKPPVTDRFYPVCGHRGPIEYPPHPRVRSICPELNDIMQYNDAQVRGIICPQCFAC